MTIIFITLQHIPSIPQSYSSISNLYELSLHLHVTNFKCGIVQVLMNIVYKTHFLSTVFTKSKHNRYTRLLSNCEISSHMNVLKLNLFFWSRKVSMAPQASPGIGGSVAPSSEVAGDGAPWASPRRVAGSAAEGSSSLSVSFSGDETAWRERGHQMTSHGHTRETPPVVPTTLFSFS